MKKDLLTDGRGVAYLGVVLGIAISVAGNVAHAYVKSDDPPLGVVISSVIWPLILFLTLEIMLSARWPAGWYFWVVRLGALGVVAAVAAVVSYQHLSELLRHWRETEFAWRYGPLAVDGLLVMGSVSLVLARLARQRLTTDVPDAAPAPVPETDTEGAPGLALVPPSLVAAVEASTLAADDAPVPVRTTARVPDAPDALTPTARQVLDALPGTISELVTRTGIKRSTVDYTLKKALAEHVRQEADKVWHRARELSGATS